ncbi:MAG TPA: S8 family serine peptidase, partial [Agromyces sp.]|nr:S8 family serine peptidase [Agromyces sp.]
MSEYPQQVTHGTGVTLTMVPEVGVALLAADVVADADPDEVLSSVGLVPVSADLTADSGPRHTRINDSGGRRWVRAPAAGGVPTVSSDVEAQLGDQLVWLAPAYQFPGVEGMEGTVLLVPDVLLVRPADGAADDAVRSRLAGLGLEPDAERSRYTAPYWYCTVVAPKERSAVELREALLRDDLVADARFETMPMLVPVTAVPNDPLYPQQWGMAKIEGPGAWDVTQGGADAVVCILDEGCDLTHPDLSFSGPGINLGTMLPDGRPTGNHGTACGGIAAATTGNALGVAGVAGRSPILPVAFQNWTDVECAAGIRYAAQNGADVLSMSFGVYGPGEGIGPVGWDFAIIDPAIDEAHAAGLVLCAATGNEDIDTFNRYPSRHPLVIACGASDQVDNRKSPTSPDGENWWGSNYAPGVTVVAPGVLIPTTDRQGTAGYNQAPGTAGDYEMTFNGTSSATPHVAGIAALIKAYRPDLSNTEIRRRIETTADKVGTVPYANQAGFPNGTRNDEMGYGRVNARRALLEGSGGAYVDNAAQSTADLT